MIVRVLLFATLRELAGKKETLLDLPERAYTVDDVRREMIRLYPRLEPNIQSALAAVNEEFSSAESPVKAGDEVAFFPPVSGGSGMQPEIFRLPVEPVDHDEIIAAITTTGTGAVCLFSGFVRGLTEKVGHIPQTEYLEYEAYESMALVKMQQVAAEIRERWPLVQGIAVVQRLGKLAVGQNTVLIACSAAHRDDGCFEAARYGIDRLKEIVPVWKKEIGRNGETWIEGEYRPDETDRTR
jgi:molybdopterin synthase catalytic subunit